MALDTTLSGETADSYGTLAAYQAYAAANGWTLAATDAENEVFLRRATQYLDRKYAFRGFKSKELQALKWPRYQVGYVEGFWVSEDFIPRDIIHAQFEAAYAFQQGVDPFATITTSSTSEMIKVGPITIDAETTPTGTPRLVALEGLLRHYIIGGAGQVALVRS